MALINIYAIIMINENNTNFKNIYFNIFSMNAVFHVKIESMPLKSNFEARVVPSGGSK